MSFLKCDLIHAHTDIEINFHFDSIRQWTRCKAPVVYVIYRVWVAIFFVVITVLSGLWENDVKWFIFLTYWAFLLLTVHAIIEVITAGYGYWKIKHSASRGKTCCIISTSFFSFFLPFCSLCFLSFLVFDLALLVTRSRLTLCEIYVMQCLRYRRCSWLHVHIQYDDDDDDDAL